MQKVTLEDLENDPFNADVTKHATEPLNLNNLALNYFELALLKSLRRYTFGQ